MNSTKAFQKNILIDNLIERDLDLRVAAAINDEPVRRRGGFRPCEH